MNQSPTVDRQMARVAAALLIACCQPSQVRASAGDREVLFGVRVEADAPGCIAGAFDRNGLVSQRRFGLANLDAGVRIDASTRFELGSTSKQFTALAILMLEADGRLQRSDPVGKYLPQLPEPFRAATLDQLIRHTSGIADYLPLARLSFGHAAAGLERRRAIELAASVPLLFPPGTRYQYSNTGYLLLADVVQAVSGEDLGTFLRRRVFKPLGMNDTFVQQASRPSPGRAGFYAIRADGALDGEWRMEDGPGAWGVRSTLRDLERWNRALNGDAAPLRAVRSAMEHTASLAGGQPSNYAAGLFVGTYRGARAVRHSGRNNIEFLRLPDIGGAVAVLCARDDVDAEVIAERMADRVFGDRLGPPRPLVLTEQHRSLLGDFVSAEGERMTLVDDNGTLSLEGFGPLLSTEDDGFTAGPSTDGLVMRLRGDGLRVQFASEPPIDLDRARISPPTEQDLRVLGGTYVNTSLRALIHIGSDGGTPSFALADGRRLTLVRLAPGLFSAGGWRIRVDGAAEGPAVRVSLSSRRTPKLTFVRMGAP